MKKTRVVFFVTSIIGIAIIFSVLFISKEKLYYNRILFGWILLIISGTLFNPEIPRKHPHIELIDEM